ncbi:hypothetical protein MKX96_06465 [Psychrobacillus sp. FSL W7-1493]|uniref:hypothetical protein n=1 Tax=Psychrobacillus sp. FSL W7-1493 TaxID=2921552 RepID=UPI0030F7632F
MDDKKLEDRLALLKSSYDRLPSTIDSDDILKKIDRDKSNELTQVKQKKMNWQRVAVWLVSAAAVLVFGIIGASFQEEKPPSNANQLANIDGEGNVPLADASIEFIERLKNNYEQEREKRREMLHLTEEEFSKISFVQGADTLYKYYTGESNSSMYENILSISTEDSLNMRYNELIHSLYLPSEMIQEVIDNGQELSEEDTAEFFNTYSSRIKELSEYFDEKGDISEEQLAALNKENLYPASDMTIQYKLTEEQVDELKNILASTFFKYIHTLEKAPFTYAGELIYSLNDSVAILMYLDEFLVSSSDLYMHKDLLKMYYTELFYAVIKGTTDSTVFDKGVVKKEYQDIWSDVVNESSSSNIIQFLLKPIVNEFESSGWTQSETWDALDHGDIEDALHLEGNGDLEQFVE